MNQKRTQIIIKIRYKNNKIKNKNIKPNKQYIYNYVSIEIDYYIILYKYFLFSKKL